MEHFFIQHHIKNKPEPEIKHNVELKLDFNEAESSFSMPLDSSLLVDTITIEDIAVKNNYNNNIFALLNLNIYITRPGHTDFNIDYWKNFAGDHINVSNLSSNTVESTKLDAKKEIVFNLIHVFDNEQMNVFYSNTSAILTIRLYSVDAEDVDNNALEATREILNQNYIYTAQNVIDYTKLQTRKANCTTPTESIFIDDVYIKHYNFNVRNASVGDLFYLNVTNADIVCFIPENYKLQEAILNLESGWIPEGLLAAENKLSKCMKISEDYDGKFDIVTISSTDSKPDINFSTAPYTLIEEDGKSIYVVDYQTLVNQTVSFDIANFSELAEGLDDGAYVDIFNIKVVNVTQDDTMPIIVNKGYWSAIGLTNYTQEEIAYFCETETVPDDAYIFSSDELCLMSHSYELTKNEDFEFCVAIMRKVDFLAHTLDVYCGVDYQTVDYQQIKQGPVCEENYVYEYVSSDGETSLKIFNFKITNVTEDTQIMLYIEDSLGFILSRFVANEEIDVFNSSVDLFHWGFINKWAEGDESISLNNVYAFNVSAGEDFNIGVITDQEIEDEDLRKIYFYIGIHDDFPYVEDNVRYTLQGLKTEYTASPAGFRVKDMTKVRNSLNGLPVTYLSCSECSIERVIIPASVTGFNFFACPLKSVIFEDGSAITEINTASGYFRYAPLEEFVLPKQDGYIWNVYASDGNTLLAKDASLLTQAEILAFIKQSCIFRQASKPEYYTMDFSELSAEKMSFNTPNHSTEIEEGMSLEIYNFKIINPTKDEDITIGINEGYAALALPNNHLTAEEAIDLLMSGEEPEGLIVMNHGETISLLHGSFSIHAGQDFDFVVAVLSIADFTPTDYSVELECGIPSYEVDFNDIKAGTLKFTTPTYNMSYLMGENGLLHIYNFTITNVSEDCEFTVWGASWITIALYGNYTSSSVFACLEDLTLLPEDARLANPLLSDFGFSYQVKAGEDLKLAMVLDVPGGNVSITDGAVFPIFLYMTPTYEAEIGKELPLVFGDIKYTLVDSGTAYTARPSNVSVVHAHNILNSINNMPVRYLNFSETSIESITIPASAIGINFNLCANLNTVMFEEGSQFTSISQYTFNQCGNLTSLSLPSSITSIEEGSFSVSRKISNITVDTNNKYYHVKDNCLIETATNKLIVAWGIPTIPNHVTSIASYAFINCADLTTITIPKSVTTINSNAFNGCANLQSVIFEENSQLSNLAGYVFSGCSSLSLINLPNSLTTIGNYGFSGCSNLSEINLPSNLTTLGNNVFSSCTSLTAIVIPRQVSSIGTGIFLACSNLTSIVVDENNTVYHLKDNCLIETATNKLIFAGPASTIPDYVEIIATYALYGLMTSVTIPSNVIEIERRAFYGCSDLTNLTLQAKDGYKWQYNDSAYTENWKDCSDNYNYAYGATHFAYGFRQVAIESVE